MLAAVLLVGCSGGDSSEPAPRQPDPTQPTQPTQPTAGEHELGFTCSFAEPTRAVGEGEFTTEMLKKSGFGVYCWYTVSTYFDPAFKAPNTHIKDFLGEKGQLLMNNQKVEWKDWNGTGIGTEVWGYTPKKYWPINQDAENPDLLTLRAYAPYVSYQLQTDVHGMPQLPVVVAATDYRKGTQHDPLWGTAKHGGSDGDEGTTYGVLYDNYTYKMSGDATDKDARDGYIDWYFHHGMSCLMFSCSVIADPGCDKVTITSITIEKLYTQGLLSLSSATASELEKPIWNECSGDMTVCLTNKDENKDLAKQPFEIPTGSSETPPENLLSHGLLIIPRDHEPGDGLKVTITYTIDGNSDELPPAIGYIKKNFEGNTIYNVGLKLTPSTGGLDIEIVQSAFTPWTEGGFGEHTVYNW